MTTIATLHEHPGQPDLLLIRTPPADRGDLLAGFEPATYSPARKAYIVAKEHHDGLYRWFRRQGVRLVDERTAVTNTSYPYTKRKKAHDCDELGCKDRAVPFGDWAVRNPELARMFHDALKKSKTGGDTAFVQGLAAVIRANL